MHDGGHQQADGLREVDELAQFRTAQQGIGIAQVGLDECGAVAPGEQRRSMRGDHRVDVHVNHPGIGRVPEDHLVGVALSRQARSEVEKLPYAALGHPQRRPLVETAVGPRALGDLGDQLVHPLSHGPIGREVGRPA